MSKKKCKIFRYIFFNKFKITLDLKRSINFVAFSNKNYIPVSNALLYKKIAFIGLAINGICFKKYYLTTIKSIMFSL